MAKNRYYSLDESGVVGEVTERALEDVLRDRKAILAYIRKSRGTAQLSNAKKGIGVVRGKAYMMVSGKKAVAKRAIK